MIKEIPGNHLLMKKVLELGLKIHLTILLQQLMLRDQKEIKEIKENKVYKVSKVIQEIKGNKGYKVLKVKTVQHGNPLLIAKVILVG